MSSPLFTQLKHKIATSWHRSQIGHRSEYSVERLLAFRDYYERTSTFHAVAVCLLSPVPALLLAILIDCIPLKDPSEGWQANYAVWIRILVATTAEALGVGCQVRAVIAPGTISLINAVKIALGTATSTMLMGIVLAATWTFPTPFCYVLLITPFVFFFVLYTIVAIGPRTLSVSSALRQQLKSQITIIASQGAVAICYPIFSAVFNRLSEVEQSAFILVMPMMKFLIKQNIANAATSYREYVGPVVVFSVDLFNVYYVAICMQASKSIATTMIIMATDSVHVILALRDIFKRQNRIHASGGPTTLHLNQPEHYLRDLPVQIREMSTEPNPVNVCHRRIRLFAPFPLQLSEESKVAMNDLANTARLTNDEAAKRRCSSMDGNIKNSDHESIPKKSFSTVPALKQHQIAPASQVERVDTQMLSDNREKAIYDALQALFHSEYVLFAEYIEFMVPILYAFYLSVVWHVPVAAYYPHTESMTAQKLKETVANILIYAAIEFVAFGALLVVLKRKFGFSPLFQLAFVLETQAPALQGHLFVWTITILHLTLTHYGVDFNILTSVL